jgi:parallel beta-helix repeat protein
VSVISIVQSKSVLVNNCDLHGCGMVGVMVSGSRDVWIEACKIHNCTCEAFFFSDSANLQVLNNTLSENANTMTSEIKDSYTFRGNTADGNPWEPLEKKE